MAIHKRHIFALLFTILAHQIHCQNWQPNNYKPALSPEGKFTLYASGKAGVIAECYTGILSLKGAGIQDSIIVSSMSCHDCQQARFFWSKTAPLLVVETNNSQCEGPRYTKVFDLSKLAFSFSRVGQLWLFDEKLDIAIISVGPDEMEDGGQSNKNGLNLYAYDVKRNRRTLIYAIESDHPVYDPLGGLNIEFDPINMRMVVIQMSRAGNATKTSIRY